MQNKGGKYRIGDIFHFNKAKICNLFQSLNDVAKNNKQMWDDKIILAYLKASADVLDHELSIKANTYLPVDETALVTGMALYNLLNNFRRIPFKGYCF